MWYIVITYNGLLILLVSRVNRAVKKFLVVCVAISLSLAFYLFARFPSRKKAEEMSLLLVVVFCLVSITGNKAVKVEEKETTHQHDARREWRC